MFKFLLRLAHCSSGSALLEMAIIIPVAISLMAGGIHFGWALSTQATVNKSVRDAARYLSTLPAGAVCGWGQSNAANLVTQNLSGSSVTITTNQPNNSCPTCPSTTPPGACFTIIVTATFPYKSIFLTHTMIAQHQEPWIGQ
jgi:Flp pilus assembly protein TadG